MLYNFGEAGRGEGIVDLIACGLCVKLLQRLVQQLPRGGGKRFVGRSSGSGTSIVTMPSMLSQIEVSLALGSTPAAYSTRYHGSARSSFTRSSTSASACEYSR